MTERAGLAAPPAGDHLDSYYATLLDSLADGVLSISPDRRIEVLNATGAAILGHAAEAIVGRSLAEALMQDEANDAFVDAILAAVLGDGGTARSVVDFHRDGDPRRLAISSTAYGVGAGPNRGKQGVVVTFNDVTEVMRLRSAERALEDSLAAEHAKLRAAYLKLEEGTAREQRAARRIGVIRTAAVAAVSLVMLAVGLYEGRGVLLTAGSDDHDARAVGAPGTMTVAAQQITSRVSVLGSMDAGSVVSVVGPFDGTVKDKSFEYGGAVDRGQALLTMDTTKTEIDLRDAESARIKAAQALDALRNWETGPDVARARRALAGAEADRANLATRTAQTKILLGKGIVAADEYNQLVQQQASQNAQLEAAKEDLATALDRGSAENRHVAELELINAQGKVDELQRDLRSAKVAAPVSGVALQPATAEGKGADLIAVGSRVGRGQTMLTIGDLESYAVRAKVDEIDVNKVHVGQAVDVTGDAFDDVTLHGVVVSVAAQSSGEAGDRNGMATFPILVTVSGLAPEQRARIHVGMSASVSIITYDNPKAIVVPPSALRQDGDGRAVVVLRDGLPVTTPVTLGTSTPNGIEVRRGLEVGDVIEVD